MNPCLRIKHRLFNLDDVALIELRAIDDDLTAMDITLNCPIIDDIGVGPRSVLKGVCSDTPAKMRVMFGELCEFISAGKSFKVL